METIVTTRSEGLRSLPWRSLGVWLLVGLLVGVFVLDVMLPGVVLLPFMYVPVVAAATFAGPRTTGLLAAMALALGLISGETNGYVPSQDYWLRLAGLAAVAAIAVYLAHLSTGREQRLVEGEQRLRMMLDNTADVVLRSAPDGTLLWASPSLRRVFGWDPDDVVGTVFRLTSSQDRPAARQAFTDAVLTQRSEYTHRTIVACADGAQRWAETSSTIVRALDGTVESVVSSIRDVTAQVETEQTLAQREQQYRLLAENATDAVFLMDSEWVIQWASPTVSTQFGYERDELLGRHRLDFVHFEDRRNVVENQLRAVSGQLERHEERFALKSGDYRWMDVAIRPFLGEGAQMLGYIAAFRDIDQEVHVRQALGRSERTFRLAMDGADEGMAVVGLHRRFLEVNHALCRLVGRDPVWLSERDEEDGLHPDDVEPARQVRDRLLGGRGDHETRPCRLIHADGSIVWVTHAVGLLRDDDGLPLFFVCQYQDITKPQRVQAAKTAHSAVKTDAHRRRSDR